MLMANQLLVSNDDAASGKVINPPQYVVMPIFTQKRVAGFLWVLVMNRLEVVSVKGNSY